MDFSKYGETVHSWIKKIEQNVYEDSELALKYCEDLVDYAAECGNVKLGAWGYYYKGVTYYVRNDGKRFYQAITDCISHLGSENDWELIARCYNFLGIFSVSHGSAAIGIDYYLTAINACEVAGFDNFKSMIKVNLGVLNIIYDRYEEAIEVLEEARDYFSKHPEHHRFEEFMVTVYENLAKAYLCKSDFVEAKCCFEIIYSEYGEHLSLIARTSVAATEAMYYHTVGKDEKCDAIIARIHEQVSENIPVMDMFEDICDYCKVLLERDKKEEFWKIIDIVEPRVKTLDIPAMILKTLGLKIQYYRKHNMQEEEYKTAVVYYDYAKRAHEENKHTVNNVISLRKTLELVTREKKEMEEANAMLQKKSETDALTGLHNRFGFNAYSEIALQDASEAEVSFAIELLDLDGFKGYNDAMGHQKGDECLQKVAGAIESMEEFGAFTARYGGDEFILIYQGKTKEEIVECAAELRKRVMVLEIYCDDPKGNRLVTISQGICWDLPVKGNRVWDFLHVADDMLYRVKQRKRNNFCIGNLTEAGDQIIMSYL